MAGGILLLGEDFTFLTALSDSFRSVSRSVMISAGPRRLRRALAGDLGEPEAVIACLDGSENIADVRALMSAYSATTFLFLSRASPPRSSMAHAIHQGNGDVLPMREEPLVIVASLVALMAQTSGAF